MANTALKYYQNAKYHIEKMHKVYQNFVTSTNLPKNDPLSVIDVGVGGGRVLNDVILPLLPENVSKIVGCDMDENMLEFCRSTNKDPRVVFEKVDITDDDIPEHLKNRFDLLFSSYCFSYVRDLRKGFTNTRKFLKPNAELLNMFQFKTNALYTTYRRMSGMKKWNSFTRDYANYTTHLSGANPEKELKEILNDAGLAILEYEFDYDLHFLMTKKEVLDAYRSLDNKALALPEDLQEQYSKDFLRIFSEETAIDFTDEKTLDEEIKFNFPTATVRAKNVIY